MNGIQTDKEVVLKFLNQLQLKPSKTPKQFWNDLSYKHDKTTVNRLKMVTELRTEGATTQDLYDLKNQSLGLSLDFSKYSGDLYRRYFEWFVSHASHVGRYPSDILDIGCDNGIVTCFYAYLFPESSVVGIDIGESGIQCANALAEKLNLTNVTFVKMDIAELHDHFPERKFDLVTSLRSFHEILGAFSEPSRHWKVEELLTIEVTEENPLVQLIRGLMRDETSEFISCERLSWIGAVTMWVKLLTYHGLNVQWDEAQFIQFHELGEEQRLPVFTCTKQQRDTDLRNEIYQLYCGQAGVPVNPFVPNTEYLDGVAEAMFEGIETKTLVSGIQVNFQNGSGRLRNELWKLDSVFIVYQYSDIGFRKLNVYSLKDFPDATEEFGTRMPAYWKSQGQDVEVYANER